MSYPFVHHFYVKLQYKFPTVSINEHLSGSSPINQIYSFLKKISNDSIKANFGGILKH